MIYGQLKIIVSKYNNSFTRRVTIIMWHPLCKREIFLNRSSLYILKTQNLFLIFISVCTLCFEWLQCQIWSDVLGPKFTYCSFWNRPMAIIITINSVETAMLYFGWFSLLICKVCYYTIYHTNCIIWSWKNGY